MTPTSLLLVALFTDSFHLCLQTQTSTPTEHSFFSVRFVLSSIFLPRSHHWFNSFRWDRSWQHPEPGIQHHARRCHPQTSHRNQRQQLLQPLFWNSNSRSQLGFTYSRKTWCRRQRFRIRSSKDPWRNSNAPKPTSQSNFLKLFLSRTFQFC